MNKLIVISLLMVQLGEKPWCSILPNTPNECHAVEKEDCDGKAATYCIWDSKDECEKNRIYSNERCEPNTQH